MPPSATSTAPTTRSQGGYKDFVDTRIRKTRAAVKTADLATGAVTLLAWVLAVVLLAAVADHWLVAGGFDRWGRFAVFAVGLLGAGLYIATRLGPTLLRSVNPLYAANEIERESPELKNSLLNLLQLRGTPGAGAKAVQQTLERQAAEGLAATGDAPIDHTPVVRAARVLLLLVAAIGAYVVASPKDFFASAGRVLAPWAEIAAPSRVQIADLAPGTAELSQGDRLMITAMVSGLEDNELAEVVYTTADGRLVERRVPMRARNGALLHSVSLPPGGGSAAALGLQGDLTYRVEAGDARTPNYRVEVRTAPTIAPTLLRYDYPAYTGYNAREVENTGDLRAIEGTRVTITAQANLPIATAQIDLGADGRTDYNLRCEGETATGRLTLRRDPGVVGDSTTSYVLRFTSTDDQANHDPPQYRVEVIADLAPEATILAPDDESLDVALNQRVTIRGDARDPDFALQRLTLVGEVDQRRVLGRELLRGNGQGKVTMETTLTPSELGLRPGDTLTYWIEAADNRTPEANVARSARQRLRVGRPTEAGENDQPGKADPDARGKPQPGGEGQPQADPNNPNAGKGGQPSDEPSDSNDPSDQDEQAPGEQGGEPNTEQGGEQRPKAELGEEGTESGDGPPPPGGLQGPGEQGSAGESDEPTEGGSEGEPGTEGGSESQPGAGGSQSSDDNNQQDPGADGTGQQGGGKSRSNNPDDTGNDAGGDSADQDPVPSNGEDDGSAFERIRKFLKDQQGKREGQEPKPREGQPQDGQEPDGTDPPDGRDTSSSQEGRKRQVDPSNGGEPDRPDPGNPETDSAKPPGDGQPGEQPKQSNEGPGAGEKDRSGRSSDSTSSDPGGETPPGDTSDPSTAPRQGTGSSGQNQSADQGAGQSADRGAGDSSGRPGGEQSADQKTGESDGSEPGQGSQSRDGGNQAGGDSSSDQQPGAGQPSGKSGSEESDTDSDQSEPGRPDPGSPETGSDNRNRNGNGKPGGDQQPLQDLRGKGSDGESTDQQGKPAGIGDRGASPDFGADGSEVGGDEANLDYAREQTELVLKRLEEQLADREVDRKLLDKLGWTERDLQRFVDRWKSRKQKATARGTEGEAQLDRALRSLGLRPEGPSQTRPVVDDQLRDLREGVRTKVPARWRDAVQSYNRSVNASGDTPASEE